MPHFRDGVAWVQAQRENEAEPFDNFSCRAFALSEVVTREPKLSTCIEECNDACNKLRWQSSMQKHLEWCLHILKGHIQCGGKSLLGPCILGYGCRRLMEPSLVLCLHPLRVADIDEGPRSSGGISSGLAGAQTRALRQRRYLRTIFPQDEVEVERRAQHLRHETVVVRVVQVEVKLDGEGGLGVPLEDVTRQLIRHCLEVRVPRIEGFAHAEANVSDGLFLQQDLDDGVLLKLCERKGG